MSLTDHIAFSKKLDDLLMKRGLMEPTDEFLYKAAISKEVAKYTEHKDLLNKAKRKEKVLHPVLEILEDSKSPEYCLITYAFIIQKCNVALMKR